MFFTPSTICCGGVVLDYFSMLMILNEQRLLDCGVWICICWDIHFLFCLTDDRLVTFHHPATFPCTVALNDIIDHCKTF